MQQTFGYTKWDHQKNENILDEIEMSPILDAINQYHDTWRVDIKEMSSSRIQRALSTNWEGSLGRNTKSNSFTGV